MSRHPQSLPWIFSFSSFAVAFGYGGKLVRSGEINGGDIVRVLLAVIIGSTGLGEV